MRQPNTVKNVAVASIMGLLGASAVISIAAGPSAPPEPDYHDGKTPLAIREKIIELPAQYKGSRVWDLKLKPYETTDKLCPRVKGQYWFRVREIPGNFRVDFTYFITYSGEKYEERIEQPASKPPVDLGSNIRCFRIQAGHKPLIVNITLADEKEKL